MFKKIDRRIIAHFDYILIALITPLVLISGMLIAEIHPALAQKHTVYVLVGIVVFIFFFLAFVKKPNVAG